MSKPVGIGVIGAGFARTVQLPVLAGCPGGRLVSMSSARPERAQAVARDFGILHVAETWRELVAHPEVELVIISTPPLLHREMTLGAVEAGKAVLCEKPAAMNAQEAESMWRAAQARGVLGLVDHELRFLPSYQHARRMVAAGELGALRHARVLFRGGGRALPSAKWSWWSDATQGGGLLGAIGSHAVDTLRFLLGQEPTRVLGMLKTHIRELPLPGGEARPVTSDDEAHLLLHFGEDITGAITLTAVESGQPGHTVELSGSRGALRIERHLLWRAEAGGTRWEPVELPAVGPLPPGLPETEWAQGFVCFARALVEAVRARAPALDGAATLEDGWRTQLVLDAARRSHMERRWCELGSSAGA